MKTGTVCCIGHLVFIKLGDQEWDYWVCQNSNYVIDVRLPDGTIEHQLRPETDKPLYNKDMRLNRHGFKWTDQQVKQSFKILLHIQ